MVRETWVQSQVKSYQRLLKWYLIPPCLTLSIIRYISRIKWSNPEKGVAPSPTPRCSSHRKGSLLVALDDSHQLYFAFTYFIILVGYFLISGNLFHCIGELFPYIGELFHCIGEFILLYRVVISLYWGVISLYWRVISHIGELFPYSGGLFHYISEFFHYIVDSVLIYQSLFLNKCIKKGTSLIVFFFVVSSIRGAFYKFPKFFFVQAFEIVVDSWKFTMLLLYIL